MKGTIFVEFLRMIETDHGLDTVDRVITRCGDDLATEGAYTSVGNYPHAELLSLLNSYIDESQAQDAAAILDRFAGYVLREFARMHPEFVADADNVLTLLESVESHIHEEVLKLYPEANPPSIKCSRTDANNLTVNYSSHRPLAPFALSLTREAAVVFDHAVAIDLVEMSEDNCTAEFKVSIS